MLDSESTQLSPSKTFTLKTSETREGSKKQEKENKNESAIFKKVNFSRSYLRKGLVLWATNLKKKMITGMNYHFHRKCFELILFSRLNPE